MSRKRNRSLSNSIIKQNRTNNMLTSRRFRNNPNRSLVNQQQEMSKSILISLTKSKNYDPNNFDLTYFNKDKLVSRNSCHYKGLFNQNDTSQVPFMSTLRQTHEFKSQQPLSKTVPRPYTASFKTTMNQSIKKNIRDIDTTQRRLSKISYRWHNKSGQGNKYSAQFQCSLRTYREQDYIFDNTIRPINYEDVQKKEYQTHELICPRQQRLFRIKG